MPYRISDSATARRIDSDAELSFGLPGRILMENAGSAAAELALMLRGQSGSIAIFCGYGKNGADGLVAARHLESSGVRAVVVRLMPETGRAAAREFEENLRPLAAAKAEIIEVGDAKGLMKAKISALDSSFIIDALIGTGLKGAPSGLCEALIGAINESKRAVLSLDMPSGCSADGGEAYGPAVKASATICFGCLKQGLFAEPAAGLAGRVFLSRIGLPEKAFLPARGELLDARLAGSLIPVREAWFHKGDMGKVAVIAGSMDMPGAAVLASKGALRGGCGICELFVPDQAYEAVLRWGLLPESMIRRLPSENGRFSGDIPADEAAAIALRDAVVVGPGIGRSPGAGRLLKALFEIKPRRLVMDADALWFADAGFFADASFDGELMLTPHAGELAHMTGRIKPCGTRVEEAVGFAAASRTSVALKGPGTVVASPDGRFRITHAGNSAMATAGSGDVLAGLAGAMCARGMEGFDALSAACLVHSLAGDMAACEAPSAISAGQIADKIPYALEISTRKAESAAGESKLPYEEIERQISIGR